jgi:hexosaminidase
LPDSKSSSGSGFYTQEDFVELLRYAAARHIEVIPEIDFPGHARAAIKSMQARERRLSSSNAAAATQYLLTEPGDSSKYESVQMWRDNVVDVGREETYRFLDVVFGELVAMYKRAGLKLESVHLGGDEVPDGVWEKSTACNHLELPGDSTIARRNQLELHFLNRASQLLTERSIQPACWEDCLLLEAAKGAAAAEKRRAAKKPVPTAYVWNNVWGWGREDAAYRLANAGFDVVLCNASNLYFDLACEKDPLERGYYWAGFVGMRAPFEFVPLDVFKNASQTSMGQPMRQDSFADRARLTPDGTRHILGIQGELWSENLRSDQTLEYMVFPRVIALAERAWAESPGWASMENSDSRQTELQADWNQFANRLGQRELPRLDYLAGGVQYRLPPPGAIIRDGRLHANVAFPGLEIRYTTDSSDPEPTSAAYSDAVPIQNAVKLRSFNTRSRGSRTADVFPPSR